MAQVDITANIATIWAREALTYLRANINLARLAYRNYENSVQSEGKTVNVPLPPTLQAQKKTKGAAYNFQANTTQTTPIVLDQNAYAAYEIDNIEHALANPRGMVQYGQAAGIAIAEQIETDLLNLYTQAGSTLGVGGTDLTKAVLNSAATRLSSNKAPKAGNMWSAIMSPKDAGAFRNDLSTTNAGAMFDDQTALREGQIGRLYGFNNFESQLAPVITGAPNVTHGMAFHNDAIALISRPLETIGNGAGGQMVNAVDEETNISVRVNMFYDGNVGSYKVVYDCLYGVKVLRPDWVIDLRS
jgi:P22 coat protein - gene protein 5